MRRRSRGDSLGGDVNEDYDTDATLLDCNESPGLFEGASGKRKAPDAEVSSEDDSRRNRRLLANRRSAARSRAKALAQVVDLEGQVDELNRDVEDLKSELSSWQARHAELQSEHERLTARLQSGPHSSSSPAAAGAPGGQDSLTPPPHPPQPQLQQPNSPLEQQQEDASLFLGHDDLGLALGMEFLGATALVHDANAELELLACTPESDGRSRGPEESGSRPTQHPTAAGRAAAAGLGPAGPANRHAGYTGKRHGSGSGDSYDSARSLTFAGT